MTRPVPLGDPRAHLMLLRRMAKSAGLDLSAAQQDGDLLQQDWAEAVTRCRRCQVVAPCQTFLDTRSDAPRPAPEGCCNADMLARLSTARAE